MVKVIRNYLKKDRFLVSTLITGFLSLLIGFFYILFKNRVFDVAASDYLENTSVLGSYITMVTNRPSLGHYFVIGFLVSIVFFFIISLVLSFYLKEKYSFIFNLLGILNIILIIGVILAIICVNFSFILTYILLFIILALYLFILYGCFDLILKLYKKRKIISLSIFIIPIILILVILKLFV